jgi:hypothetical protein
MNTLHPFESAAPWLRASDPLDGDDAGDAPAMRAPARLLEFDRNRHVALPVHATLEVIEQPEIVRVPGAAYYMLGMLRWNGRQLPVLDLCTLLNAHAKAGAPRLRHALIVAYQTAPRQPIEHAAIATASLPQTVQVGDDAQCPLPDDGDLWPLISISCFQHQGQRVPVVDIGRLFGAYWG